MANLMCGIVFADGNIVALVCGHLVKHRPQTYISWFLATFSLKKYPFVLRYRVYLPDQYNPFAITQQNHTLNAATMCIINILNKFPKGTLIGHTWSIYGNTPLGEFKYKSKFNLRKTAVSVLFGLRDFFTDSPMTREEQGDESLDYVTCYSKNIQKQPPNINKDKIIEAIQDQSNFFKKGL